MTEVSPALVMAKSVPSAAAEDWWGRFHVLAFLSLTLADREIERRELVWAKAFFRRARRPECYEQLQQLAGSNGFSRDELHRLASLAAAQMPRADKRRFVYDLAQMCKAKGKMSSDEYENVLALAELVGVEDTVADSIINSVFSINDSFAAIVGLLALGAILYFTRPVIVPLVIALFVSMIVNKVEGIVATAMGLKRFRWLNKIAAMVIILGFFFVLGLATVHSGKLVAARLPFYQEKLLALLNELAAFGQAHALPGFDLPGLLDQMQRLPLASTAGSFLGSLVNLVGNFVLVVVFTGFLVFSSPSYEGLLGEMNDKITGYVIIKSLGGLVCGLMTLLLCAAFGVDFALFWAILVFLLNYVPAVGAVVSTIPPILLALIQLESPPAILVFAGLLVMTQVLVGQVLEPKLMGDRLAVKPLAILLGLIFWGFLWGIPGMFLAAPLMALLRILASYFNFSRSFERLLAAD